VWSRVIHIFANMRACVCLVVVMAVMAAVMVGGGAQMSTTHMSHSLPIGLNTYWFQRRREVRLLLEQKPLLGLRDEKIVARNACKKGSACGSRTRDHRLSRREHEVIGPSCDSQGCDDTLYDALPLS